MLYLLDHDDEAPRRFRRAGPCRRFAKGGSSATTENTNTTQDNKRTVTGDATNVEGNGNTIQVQRADAAVLSGVTQLLGDVSYDNAQTVAAGLNAATALGINTQAAAVTLGTRAFDSADKQLKQNADLTTQYINATNQQSDALQKQQESTLRALSDSFTQAKTADAEQVNKLATNGLIAACVVGVPLLLSLALKKK